MDQGNKDTSESSAFVGKEIDQRIEERVKNLKHQAKKLQQRVIKETGGTLGIREQSALESAVAAPFATYFGEDLHPDVHDKAAALLRSLSQNHPFNDGNKRTSFGMTYSFLLEYGLGFKDSVGDDEIANFCISVAEGNKKVEEISEWLRQTTNGASGRSFLTVMKKFQAYDESS